MAVEALPPEALYRRCEADLLEFERSDEIREGHAILGQDRALEALDFGMQIDRDGYNLFVLGPPGYGRHAIVHRIVREHAKARPAPDDWIYVHNFDEPHRPRALRLPPGRALRFREEMDRLIEELRAAIPSLFQSDEYRTLRQALEEEFRERQENAFSAIQREAEQRGLTLMRTPTGFVLVPVKDGEVMQPEAFRALPEEERKRIESDIEELQGKLQEAAQQIPEWEGERRKRVRDLNRETSRSAIGRLIGVLQRKYASDPAIVAHLERIERDLVDHVEVFLAAERGDSPTPPGVRVPGAQDPEAVLRRYRVNVIVGGDGKDGAPVATEDLPTHPHLVGRVEHRAEMGALLTDFTLIAPGALHRANGGYLVLDAAKLLQQPFAYDSLKRALRGRRISLQSLQEMLSLISTVSLDPEPIPLSVKVILVGERWLYYMLSRMDPDFPELFKVGVDFEEDVERNETTVPRFAYMAANLARRHDILPLSRDGMARVVEHAARLAGDSGKLSIRVGQLADLLREAEFWAKREGAPLLERRHVQSAIEAQRRRFGRIPERIRETILKDVILIDTDGGQVGQVNGLAVSDFGTFAFGRPSRITARVRMGSGEVIDIERRVELGGPLHSKGILILSAYLGARYSERQPLSLSASLVFEQSYAGVDGDSASSAELYALLSALSELPARQDLAITGSVNQFGQVQAIGGVNEKIEGFFELCRERGLTGRQGVLIPHSNVRHLMLREEVVEAARQGRFHIYPIRTIDEGIELLTGCPAGQADEAGLFPEGTVNRRVQDRLQGFAEMRRKYGLPARGGSRPEDSRDTEGKP